MGWARLDDGFHDHPKVDPLSLAAVGLWSLCLTHAHRHRKTAAIPGHVAEARVRKLAGKQTDTLAAELVAARLWEAEPNIGGWVVHDFAEYLPKERDPNERREAGRKGAAKRWEADSNLPSTDMASDSSRASAPAFPTRPDPTRTTDDGDSGGQRYETLDPVDARCTAHQGVEDPGPCRGCMASRESAERNLTASKARRVDAARNCPDCRGGNWLEDSDGNLTRKCDHRGVA